MRKPHEGFDDDIKSMVDIIQDGIIDPAKVVGTALTDAVLR